MTQAGTSIPPRARTARRWLAFAALLAALAAAWLARAPRFEPQEATLPDGTVVRLELVSVGRGHLDPGAPAWRRLLAALPPGALRRLPASLGPATAWQSSATNESLGVWIALRGGPLGPDALPSLRPVIQIAGPDAVEYGMVSTAPGFPTRVSAARHGFFFGSFPRRTKDLEIRIHANGPGGPGPVLHAFHARNPSPLAGTAPAAPGPFPARVPFDGLEVVVEPRPSNPSQTGLPDIPPMAGSYQLDSGARLVFRSNGAPVGGWQVRSITGIRDASGNHSHLAVLGPMRLPSDDGEEARLLHLPMDAAEAWWATVLVARTRIDTNLVVRAAPFVAGTNVAVAASADGRYRARVRWEQDGNAGLSLVAGPEDPTDETVAATIRAVRDAATGRPIPFDQPSPAVWTLKPGVVATNLAVDVALIPLRRLVVPWPHAKAKSP